MDKLIEFKRPSWHQVFGDMLDVLAKRSTCLKMKTSAMVVKDNQIIATGYNGTFDKHLECNAYWLDYYKKLPIDNTIDISCFTDWVETNEFKELHRIWSKANELHAEANALKWISRNQASGCILYTRHSPCDACAKDIIAHNIKTVYYKYLYKHGSNAIDTLTKAGVVINKIEL
jgi:dCMP deaminase